MLVAYTFWDALWTMVVFFALLAFLIWVVMLMFDNFRRPDHSGWAKAGWFILIIFFPVIGAIAYTVTRPTAAGADEFGTLDGRSSTSAEIGRLHELRMSGAIGDDEFEQLKKQTISGA